MLLPILRFNPLETRVLRHSSPAQRFVFLRASIENNIMSGQVHQGQSVVHIREVDHFVSPHQGVWQHSYQRSTYLSTVFRALVISRELMYLH
jgi:hypothetical protein